MLEAYQTSKGKGSMSRADDIRKYVVSNFANVGEFKTRDVLTATEEWPSSNVSSALNDFAKGRYLVNGYRLARQEGKSQGTQVWKLVKAEEAAETEGTFQPGKTFTGRVLKINSQTGAMVVATEDDVFKVTPLDWS
jgi:hypothetical protein